MLQYPSFKQRFLSFFKPSQNASWFAKLAEIGLAVLRWLGFFTKPIIVFTVLACASYLIHLYQQVYVYGHGVNEAQYILMATGGDSLVEKGVFILFVVSLEVMFLERFVRSGKNLGYRAVFSKPYRSLFIACVFYEGIVQFYVNYIKVVFPHPGPVSWLLGLVFSGIYFSLFEKILFGREYQFSWGDLCSKITRIAIVYSSIVLGSLAIYNYFAVPTGANEGPWFLMFIVLKACVVPIFLLSILPMYFAIRQRPGGIDFEDGFVVKNLKKLIVFTDQQLFQRS